MQKRLILIKEGSEQVGAEGLIVNWSGEGGGQDMVSLPEYVDTNGDRLRDTYLSLVDELGESKIGGCTVRQHLDLGTGYSLWWLTLLSEKCSVKSTWMFEIFKVLAIIDLFVAHRCTHMVVYVSHEGVQQSLRRWCLSQGYTIDIMTHHKRVGNRSLNAWMPQPVRGLLYLLRFCAKYRPMFGKQRDQSTPVDEAPRKRVAVFTYLDNFDTALASQGTFRSKYWNGLHDLLDQSAYAITYIHQYVYSDACKTPREAEALRAQFNQTERPQTHYYLRNWFSFKVLWQVLVAFVRIVFKSYQLRGFKHVSGLSSSTKAILPLLQHDWKASSRGGVAMSELLRYFLFHAALASLDQFDKGIYVMEGQVWERSLIEAWRTNHHGKLIGSQHATLPFFDLRLPYHKRIFSTDAVNLLYPDVMAANGRPALASLLADGIPDDRVQLVEALRYQYLSRALERERSDRSGAYFAVILDGVTEVDAQQLDFFTYAYVSMPESFEGLAVLIKPHPNPQTQPEFFLKAMAPELINSISTRSLGELWDDISYAFISGGSSACVEAGLMGIPMVLLRDLHGLNRSPLRGFSGVAFVSTRTAFVEAWKKGIGSPGIPKDYFCLDEQLPRWQALLKA